MIKAVSLYTKHFFALLSQFVYFLLENITSNSFKIQKLNHVKAISHVPTGLDSKIRIILTFDFTMPS